MNLLRETGLWLCHTKVEKWDPELGDLPYDPAARRDIFARTKPLEVIETEGNLLVTGATGATGGGIQGMLERLIGTTTSPAYSNANARIGVGDSTTAAANSQTDLQAATNKLRKAMNATYPTGPTAGALTFQSDFITSEANYAWNEWAVFNTATAAQGMLNRKQEGLGTKASGTWTLTVTITIT